MKIRLPAHATQAAPSPAKAGARDMTACPLCGLRFAKKGAACVGCKVNPRCILLRCPHCHYEFVEDSIILQKLSTWWHFLKKKVIGHD